MKTTKQIASDFYALSHLKKELKAAERAYEKAKKELDKKQRTVALASKVHGVFNGVPYSRHEFKKSKFDVLFDVVCDYGDKNRRLSEVYTDANTRSKQFKNRVFHVKLRSDLRANYVVAFGYTDYCEAESAALNWVCKGVTPENMGNRNTIRK